MCTMFYTAVVFQVKGSQPLILMSPWLTYTSVYSSGTGSSSPCRQKATASSTAFSAVLLTSYRMNTASQNKYISTISETTPFTVTVEISISLKYSAPLILFDTPASWREMKALHSKLELIYSSSLESNLASGT